MCGCMLMHAMMNHEEHQHSSQSMPASGINGMSTVSGKKCSHCGFPIEQGFAFCPNCGMNLKTTECPACGQKVDPSWSACAYCGSPLGEAEKQSAPQ
jgi:predicted amidophosphoribosyltransferase